MGNDNSQEIWESIYSAGRHLNIVPYSEVITPMGRFFSPLAGKKVLEIGCGAGNNILFASYFLKMEVFGIDYSQTAIETAKNRFSEFNLNYGDLLLGDASSLPFKDNYFDLVLDRATLQHNNFLKIKDILNEVKRVLKKGGGFICACTAEEHPLFNQGEYLGNGDFFSKRKRRNKTFFCKERYFRTLF